MYKILLYGTLILGMLPLILILIKIRRFEISKPISPFIWLTFFATLYEYIFTIVLKNDSIYWFQAYPLLSFLTIYYFFFKELNIRNKITKGMITISFMLSYFVSFLFLEQDIFISSSVNRIFISFFVFVCTIIWFKKKFDDLISVEVFNKNEFSNLWEISSFYFVTGLFLYYSTTFLLFLSSNVIFKSDLYFYDFWLINIFATLVLRILLIISVWKMKKA